MKTKNHQDVIIIGGGISGLLCATKINNRLKTTILDKGRNFGGRLATREFNGAIFDHGAQYFTAKSSQFQNYVNKWHKEKIIKVRKTYEDFLMFDQIYRNYLNFEQNNL